MIRTGNSSNFFSSKFRNIIASEVRIQLNSIYEIFRTCGQFHDWLSVKICGDVVKDFGVVE